MKIKHKYTGKSLLELREEFGIGSKGFWNQSWYLNEPFAKEKAPKGVYEIDFERQLTSLTYDQQKEKIPKGYDFPHPAVLVEAILTHYKKTGEKLLEDWWSRTSVRSSVGHFVFVGGFDSDGLCVDRDARGGAYSILGVCPARLVSRKLGKLGSSELDFLETSGIYALNERVAELEKFKERVEKVVKLD